MDRPFYYTNVDADPTDPDVVSSNDEGFFKSTDGGRTWPRGSTPHGDNHDMWINPDDPDIFVQSNDGGANVTLDGGRTWSTQLNQPTAELYQVDLDDQFPTGSTPGSRTTPRSRCPANQPRLGSGRPQAHWEATGGCETGPAVPKPGDPDIVYANCKGRFGVYNRGTGQEQQYYVGCWNLYGHNPEGPRRTASSGSSPIHVSPHNPTSRLPHVPVRAQ